MKSKRADQEVIRSLRRASSAAARVYRDLVAETELTARQAGAILALIETPGMTLNGLATAIGSDQATASSMVDRLLAAELVRRETDPDDRRRARLQPTEKALLLGKRLHQARRRAEDMIRQALGPEDSEELLRILQRLVESLHGAETKGNTSGRTT